MFDVAGGTWLAVVKQLTKDRTEYLEGLITSIDGKETDRLRGRIMMIDEILERYPKELKPGDRPNDF